MAYKRSRQTFESDLQKQDSPFVLYGTPLPSLDEHSRDDGSYVPVWKQEVTDDRGRKRLHGAFTGGFSAGYYNTVGSKEGWTPSTFVSSRANRAKDAKKATQQRPEDFMDEEDLREAEESRNLTTNTEYAGFGTADDPAHKDNIFDLFRPAESTMGAKLLNKMGWKEGQGIGPRVRRPVDSGREGSEMRLFAPEDAPMLSFMKKADFKGLGCDAVVGSNDVRDTKLASQTNSVEQSDDDDEARPGLNFANRPKKLSKSSRSGFGVGILNDTGSDEEDPYSMGPRISYNKAIGGEKKSKKKKISSTSNANPLLKTKPVFISKKLSSLQATLRKCHDGRLPLTGFILANDLDGFASMNLDDEKYKPPEVPDGWRPSRVAQDSDEPSSANPAADQRTTDAARSFTHTFQSRASALGEQLLPGKSVFDFMTPEARDRLVKASGKTNLPPAMSERPETSNGTERRGDSDTSLLQQIPRLDATTAQQALQRSAGGDGGTGSWMPYSEDLPKRSRYKQFLEYSALSSTLASPDGASLPLPKPTHFSDEDYVNEVSEFTRAAQVFRPVSGLMASRFTSSTTSAQSTNLPNESASTSDLLLKRKQKIQDPATEAAIMSMFGPLTRSVANFYPTKLVCKRFACPMPNPEYNINDNNHSFTTNTTAPPDPAASNISDSNRFQSRGYQYPEGEHPAKREIDEPEPINTKNQETEADAFLATLQSPISSNQSHSTPTTAVTINPDQNEALEAERPGQAVFRAIFGDESDEDD